MAVDKSLPSNNHIKTKETVWQNGVLVEVNSEDIPRNPVVERMLAYRVDVQLNHLYDDIKAGLFGEAAKSGEFCRYVEFIKNTYPKN